MGQTRPLFVYFRPFLNTMTNTIKNLTIKSVDGLLGTRNRGRQMVDTDESTELWGHPYRQTLDDVRLEIMTLESYLTSKIA